MPLADEELVSIRVFPRRTDYVLARQSLDQEGVPCFSRAELARRAPQSTQPPAGRFAIVVRKGDVEKALAILDAPPLPDGYVISEWFE